jgi:hypothetical protein
MIKATFAVIYTVTEGTCSSVSVNITICMTGIFADRAYSLPSCYVTSSAMPPVLTSIVSTPCNTRANGCWVHQLNSFLEMFFKVTLVGDFVDAVVDVSDQGRQELF